MRASRTAATASSAGSRALVVSQLDPRDERFEAETTVLEELIEHHVEEEGEDLFKAAAKLGTDRLNELGLGMSAHRSWEHSRGERRFPVSQRWESDP